VKKTDLGSGKLARIEKGEGKQEGLERSAAKLGRVA